MTRPLSPCEAAVGALLARGLCNKEIAAERGMPLGTVKNHVTTIFNKLGARNRTEAALKLAGVL